MRVYIGPYVPYISAYYLADKLFFFLNDDRRDALGEWLSNTVVGDFFEWVYKKRKRIIKVHIDNYDTWNADLTLAIVIVAVLNNIRKSLDSTNGFPIVEDADVPDNLKMPEGVSPFEADDLLLISRYSYILDRMIEGFEITADPDKFWLSVPPDEEVAAVDKFMEDQESKQKEALRLFAKYFRHLWH
jgi:hypothetical protein